MGEDSRRTSASGPGPERGGLAPTLDSSTPGGASGPGAVAIQVNARGAPQRIGRFQILRQIGAGGMGVVYAAYDQKLDRRLALKLVRSDAAASEPQRARIVREAQAMARISHPNVVPVYEVGEVEGHVFIAMELVEGTTLSAWQRGKPWQRILGTYIAAAEGLHAAHSVGLVHRDFKPDSVPPKRARRISIRSDTES
ncbi:MAG: serine/threonine-protein kinase [Polyangia bacterium]